MFLDELFALDFLIYTIRISIAPALNMARLPGSLVQDVFRFGDLPTELKFKMLEEILGPAITSPGFTRLNPRQTWPFRIQCRPIFATSILRVSQDVHTAAKTILDSTNM
jgi:hypothetical protein